MTGKAAATKAGGRTPKRKRPAASRTGGGWWAGLCCGALLLLSPGTSLVLLALLFPGLCCAAAAGRGYPTTRAMLLFGLAGSVPTLFGLLGRGATIAAALDVIRSPTALVSAWAAAAAGWLVTEAAAATIATTWRIRDGIRKRAIDREIETAEAEWGPLG